MTGTAAQDAKRRDSARSSFLRYRRGERSMCAELPPIFYSVCAKLSPIFYFVWLYLQVVWACFWDDFLDRIFKSRQPGTLVINLDRCRAWVEKPSRRS